jgi:hypothetical protein
MVRAPKADSRKPNDEAAIARTVAVSIAEDELTRPISGSGVSRSSC